MVPSIFVFPKGAWSSLLWNKPITWLSQNGASFIEQNSRRTKNSGFYHVLASHQEFLPVVFPEFLGMLKSRNRGGGRPLPAPTSHAGSMKVGSAKGAGTAAAPGTAGEAASGAYRWSKKKGNVHNQLSAISIYSAFAMWSQS